MTKHAVNNIHMSKKNDEPLDFSTLFKDAKPVSHNQYVLTNEERKQKRKKESHLRMAKKEASAQKMSLAQLSSSDYLQHSASVELSDIFEAHWDDDKPIKYYRKDAAINYQSEFKLPLTFSNKDMLKKLSMGYFTPEIEIDLHGQTGQQAKAEILAVIFEAKKRHFACIGIIHGHGNGTLKRKVPNWLVQHPDVAGFVQAPREYGGKAGLLVLIGIDFQVYKPE